MVTSCMRYFLILAIAMYCCIIVCQGIYDVVLLFGMWEESVVPRENPLVHKNIQTLPRKAEKQSCDLR